MLPTLVAVIKLHSPCSEDQPPLPQTFQLLRTILIKNSTLLYHNLLQDLRQLSRLQLVNTRNKEIRYLCKQILSLYLRERADL